MTREIRRGVGRVHTWSEAEDPQPYHGGIVITAGPYNKPAIEAQAKSAAEAFIKSIQQGIEALENGSSEFAPDAEPVPGAPVEVFDIFDVSTGEHLMIWRVATRDRFEHAN